MDVNTSLTMALSWFSQNATRHFYMRQTFVMNFFLILIAVSSCVVLCCPLTPPQTSWTHLFILLKGSFSSPINLSPRSSISMHPDITLSKSGLHQIGRGHLHLKCTLGWDTIQQLVSGLVMKGGGGQYGRWVSHFHSWSHRHVHPSLRQLQRLVSGFMCSPGKQLRSLWLTLSLDFGARLLSYKVVAVRGLGHLDWRCSWSTSRTFRSAPVYT